MKPATLRRFTQFAVLRVSHHAFLIYRGRRLGVAASHSKHRNAARSNRRWIRDMRYRFSLSSYLGLTEPGLYFLLATDEAKDDCRSSGAERCLAGWQASDHTDPEAQVRLKLESSSEEKRTLLETRDYVRDLMLHLAKDNKRGAEHLLDELAVLMRVEGAVTRAFYAREEVVLPGARLSSRS